MNISIYFLVEKMKVQIVETTTTIFFAYSTSFEATSIMSKRKLADTDLANDDETEPYAKWRKVAEEGSIIKQSDAKQPNLQNVEQGLKEEKKNDQASEFSMTKIDVANFKSMLNKLNKDIQELYHHKARYNINDNGSVTFYPTPNCKPATDKLETNKISLQSILEQQDCTEIYTYSDPDQQVIQPSYPKGVCSFITGAIMAWSEHYPFRIRVEHIWLLILQAVAIHVDQNAEKLRSKYVEHEGKVTLKIDIPGVPSREEWQSVIETFVEMMDKNTVKDTCQLFECDFSGSTMIETVATKATIMDVCKNYFHYHCRTKCGFPKITLDGNKADWIKLKEKTEKLLKTKVDKKFGAQWGESLLPLLDRFIMTFDGEIDCVFWNSMIKRGSRGGSGGYAWFSGWFNILFPFINDKPNEFCVSYSMDEEYVKCGFDKARDGGNDRNDYPLGLSVAPATWDRFGKLLHLKFIAGFVGYTQDENTLEICPNVGWCIAKAIGDKEIKEKDDNKNKNKSSFKFGVPLN